MKGIIMENQENNMSELDQLKAQYETLKQQFDQQEIVNDRLMKSAIQANATYFSRYRKTVMIAYPILAIFGFAYFTCLGELWPFGILFLLLLAVMIVAELCLTRNVRRQVMENSDLLTLSRNMQKLKTNYAIYSIFILVFGFLFVNIHVLRNKGYLTHDIAQFNMAQNYDAISTIVFVGVLLLVFAALAYRNFVSHCNEVIRQIDTIEGKPSSKQNRSFWYVYGAMIVVFVAGIYLAYVSLRPVVYNRSDNDLSSAGELAIWEVYADTMVSANEAPSLMKQWQQNDSVVVMKGKENKKQEVRLYAMRKSTAEGPAISSAVIDGKPIVQRVIHGTFRKENTPIIVGMTLEASQAWYQFTTKEQGLHAALTLNGVVVQEWIFQSGIDNGQLFIMEKWSSKEELEAFCEQLIRQ